MFAIINDGDGKYFGEAFTDQSSVDSRIEELEEYFGKGAFYSKEFYDYSFGDTCEICLNDGSVSFALDNNDKDGIKRCCNCA